MFLRLRREACRPVREPANQRARRAMLQCLNSLAMAGFLRLFKRALPLVLRWRAAVAAALICLAGPAAAQGEMAFAPPDSVQGERAASDAQGHDRSAPPAAEEEEHAIDLSIVYTAELFSNVRGGLERSARYLDNLDVTLRVDAERAFGWRGATLFAYGLYNNGEPFSEDLVGAVQGVSNIETGVRRRAFTKPGSSSALPQIGAR
jgi:carbohydrate-selective porin OprB